MGNFDLKGPSIKDVGSLEGGRGVRIADMGRYDGGRCKKNTISAIQDWQILTFFVKMSKISDVIYRRPRLWFVDIY